MSSPPSEVTVATFNVHAGIDGWGRTFDVAAACREIDADVLVLQEVWKPADGPSMATEVADELACAMTWRTMAEGRRGRPHPRASESWMRIGDYRSESNSLFLDSERPVSRRVRASERYQQAEPGAWGLAVLTRLPATNERVLDLGRLPVDRAMRAVVLLDVDVGGATLVVGGTHMSHLTSGSPLQYLRLRHHLERMVGDSPAVLAGDMNLWGPPTEVLLHGWHRAVIGRTWPSWRPHSQVDHVLTRGPVTVREAEVLRDFGSDHLALRVRLALS